jgi:hypothetical protein
MPFLIWAAETAAIQRPLGERGSFFGNVKIGPLLGGAGLGSADGGTSARPSFGWMPRACRSKLFHAIAVPEVHFLDISQTEETMSMLVQGGSSTPVTVHQFSAPTATGPGSAVIEFSGAPPHPQHALALVHNGVRYPATIAAAPPAATGGTHLYLLLDPADT